MRILSIGPDKDLLKSGTASFLRHVEYAKHCEELHAVIFARKKFGNKVVQIAPNAWVHPTYSRGVVGLFVDAYRLGRKILKERGEWVISAQDPFESGIVAYALSRATGVPFLIQEHGDFFSAPCWRQESLVNSVRYYIGLWILRRADHVRPVSERIATTLERFGVARTRMTVAAVYTETFAFRQAVPDRDIASLQPEGGVLILTMARFVPQKNLAMLIHAFKRTFARGVRARLLIVGRGPDEVKLRALARTATEGTILFRDWVENPEAVIKAADIYALSSNYEGWGRVCAEALAAGVPLVMTDVGCAGEVVVNGKNGTVVPVGDEQAFADALYTLATDAELRQKYAESGKETVAHMVTTEESVALYLESLQACLKSRA